MGRKAVDKKEYKGVVKGIRMTDAESKEFDRRGGATWLRKLLKGKTK